MIYTNAITSRTGLFVPVFHDGLAAHSKYDPRREAERLALTVSPAGFFVVSGAAGGYFIEALRRRFPSSPIVAAEGSEADIAYLVSLSPLLADLIKDSATVIVPISQLCDAITARYIPVLHGTLGIIEWETWAHSNANIMPSFRLAIARAKETIAADASTQARFGKIWQRNILLNVRALNDGVSYPLLPTDRCALIAAAGPSLDDAVPFIKEERKRLFVIATDTAFLSLTRQGIACDAVVSIDGQEVSHSHFMGSLNAAGGQAGAGNSPSPLFVMDLTADNSVVRHLLCEGCRVCFVRTGHPLAAYLAPHLPLLMSGGGTVTIAACDWARRSGFLHIAVAGADFAYLDGRPYSRGTYLDDIYSENAVRTDNVQTAFCRLMFRTPLENIESQHGHVSTRLNNSAVTTSLLRSYEESYHQWLSCHHYEEVIPVRETWREYRIAADIASVQECRNRNDDGAALRALRNDGGGGHNHASLWIKELEDILCNDGGRAANGGSPEPALMAALPCAAYLIAHTKGMTAVEAVKTALSMAKRIVEGLTPSPSAFAVYDGILS